MRRRSRSPRLGHGAGPTRPSPVFVSWESTVGPNVLSDSKMSAVVLLTAVTYAALAAAAIAALLIGTSFTRRQRTRFPMLAKLDGKQIHLFVTATLFIAIGYAAYAARDILVAKNSFAVSEVGLFARVKATPIGFQREVADSASSAVNAAGDHFAAGDRLWAEKKLPEAARQFEISASILPTKSAYLNAALMREAVGERDAARTLALSGISLRHALDSRKADANLWLVLGRVDISIPGRDGERDAAFTRSTKLFSSLRDADGLTNVLMARAGSNIGQNPLLAERQYTTALQRYTDSGNELGAAGALLQISIIRYQRSNLAGAIQAGNEALAIFRQGNNVLGQIGALNQLAGAYAMSNDSKRAVASLEEAAVIAERSGDRGGAAMIQVNLAHMYMDQGLFVKGISVASIAATNAHDLKYEEVEGYAILIRGIAESRNGEMPASLDDCRRAVDVLEHAKSLLLASDAHASLSTVCSEFTKDVKCAMTHADRAFEISQQLRIPLAEAEARAALAEAYELKGDKARARVEIRKAVTIYDGLGVHEHNYDELHALLKRLGG
jgi:tetratricopeptide (TPR) repeat protein